MMTNAKEIDGLRRMNACSDAIEWLEEAGYSLALGWQRCRRGAWMLWWAAKVGADRKTLVLAACDCAELSREYWPEDDARSAEALRVARSWARDEGATIGDVRFAAYAAAAAAYNAASYAAYAASYAAAAAYASVSYAAYADAASSDADEILAECATICRRYWPTVPRGGGG